jgi:excisionase family DNA binding protein
VIRGDDDMVRERYLNTKEVAEMLSIGQEYLRQLLREGKIKGIKVGKRWKIKESDIQELTKGVKNWIDWHQEEEL